MSIGVFNRGRSGLALETATGEAERDSLKAFPIIQIHRKIVHINTTIYFCLDETED